PEDGAVAGRPPEMGGFARQRLERRGFEVRLGTPIREVREAAVVIGEGEVIPTRTVVWTGGVRPAPMVARSGVEVDHAGRVKTRPTMETSRSTAFAIAASAVIPKVEDPNGRPLPPPAKNPVREAKPLPPNTVPPLHG